MADASETTEKEKAKVEENAKKEQVKDNIDHSPKIALFELLSHLRITLVSRAQVEANTSSFPAAYLTGRGTYLIEVIDRILSELRVWVDDPNDVRYLIHECAHPIRFDSLDGYLSATVSDFRIERSAALTILKEPPKISLTRGGNCYDPTVLGFPTEGVLSSSVLDEQLREILSNVLQSRILDGVFAETVSFDYQPRAESRRRIMNYAIQQSLPTRDLFSRAYRAYSAEFFKTEPDVKTITALETVYPTVRFNLAQGIFDEFTLSGYHLRYEIISTLNSFKMPLQPIAASDLIKTTGSNTSKSSWLGQLSTTTYEPFMASEITAFMASFLTPGQMLLEVDLNDLGEASDLKGIAALGCMMITMFDANSTFSNITQESVRTLQSAIVKFGLDAGVLEKNNLDSAWPLNRVDYKRDGGDLNRLRLVNGRSGLNEGIIPIDTDRMLQIFQGIGRRINYATDHDDIDEFNRTAIDHGTWTLPNAIADFGSRCKNHSYLGPFFKTLGGMIVKFFVRLNQYLKVYWYNPVRESSDVQDHRNYRDSAFRAIRHPLSGKTILHIIRCLNDVELTPSFTFEETLSIYSGMFRSLIDTGSEMRVLMNEIRQLRVANEYTAKARMEMLNTSDPFIKYVMDTAKLYNELNKIGSRWLEPYSTTAIGACFEPLILRNDRQLVPKGVLKRFVARIKTNVLDQAAIERLIQDQQIYINIDDVECEVANAVQIRALVGQRRFNSVMFNTSDTPIELQIPIPYKLIHQLPIGLEPLCVSVNRNVVDISLRKALKISELIVSMVSFDARRLLCPDDYTPCPLLICVNHVRGEDIRYSYQSINDFFGRINEMCVGVMLVCNPLHSFVRLT